MNILIALGLICISGGAMAQFEGCKACEYGVKVFFGHLREQKGVNFQIATLSREVCPQMEDWFLCDYEVGKRWAGIIISRNSIFIFRQIHKITNFFDKFQGINHIIYDDGAAPYICSSLGAGNCTQFEQNER